MAAAALPAPDAPAKKGPSLVIQLAVLLVLTVVAVGGGWFAGGSLGGHGEAAAPAAAPAGHGAAPAHGAAPDAEAAGHSDGGKAEPIPVGDGHSMIYPMAPLTTNLAAPSNVWIRMELSLVFDSTPEDPTLPDQIHQDLLAFVRTLKLHQIEGASGFQHLRADLEDRASIRSAGLVKRILIRTLLFE